MCTQLPGGVAAHKASLSFEMPVVVIIIGILPAIAVPAFLTQRQQGYDATATSDLRNLAGFEEIYLNDYDAYGTLPQVLSQEPKMEVSSGVTLTVVWVNGPTSYCLSAQHSGLGAKWFYDSIAGGL